MATESIADLGSAAIAGADPIFSEQTLPCSYIKDESTTNELSAVETRSYPPMAWCENLPSYCCRLMRPQIAKLALRGVARVGRISEEIISLLKLGLGIDSKTQGKFYFRNREQVPIREVENGLKNNFDCATVFLPAFIDFYDCAR